MSAKDRYAHTRVRVRVRVRVEDRAEVMVKVRVGVHQVQEMLISSPRPKIFFVSQTTFISSFVYPLA